MNSENGNLDIIFQWSIYPYFNICIIESANNKDYNFNSIETHIDEYMSSLVVRINNTINTHEINKLRLFVVIGPGSYTGIRQTIGFVMGMIAGLLSKGHEIGYLELVSVDSFDMIKSIILSKSVHKISSISKNGRVFIQGLPRIDIMEKRRQSTMRVNINRLLGFYKDKHDVIDYLELSSLLEGGDAPQYIYMSSAIKEYVEGLLSTKQIPHIESQQYYGLDNEKQTDIGSKPYVITLTPSETLKTLRNLNRDSQGINQFIKYLTDFGKKSELSIKDANSLDQLLHAINPLYVNRVNITKPKRAAF